MGRKYRGMRCGRRPRRRIPRRLDRSIGRLDHSNGNGSFLPDDIVHEILVRLPVRTLLRFKCVCKSWCALFSSPRFIDSHLQRAKESPTLLITTVVPYVEEGKISMYRYDDRECCTRLSRRVKFMFDHRLPRSLDVLRSHPHSNGLILLNTSVGLILCNPGTREYRPLPGGSFSARTTWPGINDSWFSYCMNRVGFGFVPSINAYKVCQYFYRSYDEASGTWSIGFKVLTLGVDSTWRSPKMELLYPVDGCSPMSVGESIYFGIDKILDTELPSDLCYFSFDLSDEKFRLVSIPSIATQRRTSAAFTKLAGDTCFYTLSIGGAKLDIWIKNHRDRDASGEEDAWTHVHNIDLLRRYRGIYLIGMRHEKLLIRTMDVDRYILVCYNPQSRSLEPEMGFDLVRDFVYYNSQQYKCRLRQASIFQVISFVESLVPVPVPLLED